MAFNPQDLAHKFNQFMARRNGPDNMSRDMFALALVLLVVGLFTQGFAREIVTTLLIVLLVYAYFRMFSSKKADRARENEAYLEKRHALAVKLHLDGVKNPFAKLGQAGQRAAEQAGREGQKRAERMQDREHRYLKCPKCRQDIRVPKGAGKIRISCPKCGEKFEKKV